MEKSTPVELTKIKKIVADIQGFPAKIDSIELAKNARQLLKKYAQLSEKIERNILISVKHQKDMIKVRTKEFKAIRQALKEKANAVLHTKSKKVVQGEKTAKKTVKTPAPKKSSKTADAPVAKVKSPKKPVKKTSPKARKATSPKEDA